LAGRCQAAGRIGDWSPIEGVIQLLTTTALAGGVLALVHLMMRLPAGSQASAGRSSLVRPRLRCRGWRNLRHAPLLTGLPTCGGIWTVSAKDSDMSSTLRLSIIMVLVLRKPRRLGLCLQQHEPKPVVQVTENTPAPRLPPLGTCRGTSATESYIGARRRFRSTLGGSDSGATGAILDTRDARNRLRFSGTQVPRRWQSRHIARPIEPARSGFSPTSWAPIAVRSASKLTRSLRVGPNLAGICRCRVDGK